MSFVPNFFTYVSAAVRPAPAPSSVASAEQAQQGDQEVAHKQRWQESYELIKAEKAAFSELTLMV